MVNYARIQHHIDHGKGIAAKKLGPPFAAYRIVSSSRGDFPDGWTQITPSFPLFRRRYTSEAKAELGLKNVVLWYDIVANMEPYVLGDIFIQIDPPYVPGVSYGDGATQLPGSEEFNGMALAAHAPVNKAIGGRLDRLVRIYRPATSPVTVGNSTSWKSTLVNDQPLVLANGSYGFGQAGTDNASLVPAGVSSIHRRGETVFGPGVPAIVKPFLWFFYIPPLPGYLPLEGDAIVDQNGARYVVDHPYEQQTGMVGYQLICDRKVGQPG